ncbi:hypothetical protein PPISBEST_215 [Bacillus phage PPIsBest]|uniref:Uncharacterized protein n=1 Tax=Bacillus phage PPIsBest TaxID=2024234 RepID=A0A222Z3V3_9CAUD|nr:hypothetical protein PPISBEST_215 [Bacillus phage PPIsBest]
MNLRLRSKQGILSAILDIEPRELSLQRSYGI